jgi:hypothetical protein
MRKTPRPHLEIQKSGKKHYDIICTTFREDGKIRHTTHGTIKDMRLEELKLLQAAFRGDVVVKDAVDASRALAFTFYASIQ